MSTQDFERLYRIVTKKMTDSNDVTMSQNRDWITSLVIKFWSEYRHWGTNEQTQGYLSRLNENRIPREVRVACQALLHIGYDLPRCLVASFRKGDLVTSHLETLELTPYGKEWFRQPLNSIHKNQLLDQVQLLPTKTVAEVLAVTTRSGTPSNEQRKLFLQLQSLFYSLMEDRQVRQLFAEMSLLTRATMYLGSFLGRNALNDLLRVVCHWMVALRNTAWIHSEMINDCSDLSIACDALWKSVDEVATKATDRCEELNRRKWNPLFVFSKLAGLSQLQPPTLLMAVVPLPLAAVLSIAVTPVTSAIFIAFAVLAYWWAVQIARNRAISEILHSLTVETEARLLLFRQQIRPLIKDEPKLK